VFKFFSLLPFWNQALGATDGQSIPQNSMPKKYYAFCEKRGFCAVIPPMKSTENTETTKAASSALSRRERGGIALGASLLVCALVGGGIYQQARATQSTPLQPVSSVQASIAPTPRATEEVATKPSPASTAITSVVVHVAGAVKKPGVYTLKSGMRIYQAVAAAGGFQKDAQQDSVNLADAICDADQIFIPSKAEAIAPAVVAAPTRPTVIKGNSPQKITTNIKAGRVLGKPAITIAPAKTKAKSTPSGATPAEPTAEAKSTKLQEAGQGYVHLNSATTDDLQKLPGVGPAMAERILAYRSEIKKFEEPTQLKDVPGIGDKKFARMEPFLRL
jgi:competence protein ComEA